MPEIYETKETNEIHVNSGVRRDEFVNALENWKNKVITTYDRGTGSASTYHMLRDVDLILSDAFGHDPMWDGDDE